MNDIVEQTDATLDITTNAPEGAAMSIFAVKMYNNSSPNDKITLATYIAPAPNVPENDLHLETSELEKGRYIVEIWADFGTKDQQQHGTDTYKIKDSEVI